MITAQDIREKTFEKSTFGGYAMNEVDDFLDELANDLAASQKENANIRAKMKVLVDKIEEYRENEDAMRLALVTAQKVAKNIQDESQTQADDLVSSARAEAEEILSSARAQADDLIAAANAQVAAITGSITQQRELEDLRLKKAQMAAADYVKRFRAVLEHENAFLDSLEDSEFVQDVIVTPAPIEPKAIPAPAEKAPVEEPEVREEEPKAVEEPDETVDYERLFEEAVFAAAETAEPAETVFADDDDEDAIPAAEDGDDAPTFRF